MAENTSETESERERVISKMTKAVCAGALHRSHSLKHVHMESQWNTQTHNISKAS